ncbi:MAG TPA: autotransporter outer membrane beta-barrel domain-containing protein [Dyella sp.]|nr:autotransporter outer membrane beta-barrel domain-containing protein [Dyella sp.]
MGIFTAASGTVTLGAPITAMALQFLTSGYRIEGNGNTLTLESLPTGAAPLIRVDPGVTATIDAVIAGTSGLEKADPGTLVLSQDNTYSGNTTIDDGVVQLGEGSTAGSITGNVINNGNLVFDRSDTYTYSGVISGLGTVTQNGSGTTVLTGASTYTGATSIQAGTLELDGSLTSDVTVQSGATLSGIGSTTGSVFNLGIVAPDPPATTGSLLIGGSYEGQGGDLLLKTLINAGGPGNQTTDRLLVVGSVVGETPLDIQELPGGTPATTGNTNVSGISVVQVGGTANAAAFALAHGYIADGPYEMRLYQFPAGTSASSELDSRLASTGVTSFSDYRLQVPTVQPPGVPTTPNPPPGAPTTPGSPGSPGKPLPPATQPAAPITNDVTPGGFTSNDVYIPAGLPVAIGPNGEQPGEAVVLPQVPMYRALSSAALNYAYVLVDDLHKRLGDVEQPTRVDDTIESFARYNNWSGSLVDNGASIVDQDIWFVQIGAGWLDRNAFTANDQLHLDLIGSLGDSNLKDDLNNARISFRAQSIGGTATYVAADGWYIDAVVQNTHYQHVRVSSPQEGVVDNFGGNGWLASVEGSYPFSFDGTIVEPRTSFTYQNVSFNHSVDADQVNVQLTGDDSMVGRVGVRVEHPFMLSDDAPRHTVSPYLTVDYTHDFHGGAAAHLSSVSFSSANAGSSIRYGAGVAAQFGPAWNVYLGFERDIARTGNGATGSQGMLGMRYVF